MSNTHIQKENPIEPTSYLWRQLFLESDLPRDGTVIEVAPGYEPKIGNALALLGFRGTVFLIEPDREAASHIQNTYQHILPRATVRIVKKTLQGIRTKIDIPCGINALVASHPFDDMVIAHIIGRAGFFSEEREGGAEMSPVMQKLYGGIWNKQYADGARATTAIWKRFIEKSKPHYFIASQYPSHTLTVKGLAKRQESGFLVLEQLKKFYKKYLVEKNYKRSFDFKGDPRWWIVAREPQ